VRGPPGSPLLPYTTLFRSEGEGPGVGVVVRRLQAGTVRAIDAPARTGGVQPGVQAVEGGGVERRGFGQWRAGEQVECLHQAEARDRKSTRLNSSHVKISYA